MTATSRFHCTYCAGAFALEGETNWIRLQPRILDHVAECAGTPREATPGQLYSAIDAMTTAALSGMSRLAA